MFSVSSLDNVISNVVVQETDCETVEYVSTTSYWAAIGE